MNNHNKIGQDSLKYQYKSRNLPHWYSADKPVFVTYRLKFTIPMSVITEFNAKRSEWFQNLSNMKVDDKLAEEANKSLTQFYWLDELISKSAEVPQILSRKDLTDVITDTFNHHNKIRYDLLAYCVMPNHVHVLFNPLKQSDGDIYPLARITYSWKRFTATKINRILKRSGALWQQESYDHMVRDESELRSMMQYIIDNPVKAGLVDKWEDWYGTWIHEDYRPR